MRDGFDMKAKSLVVGLTLLTSGTVIGISTQQLASADVSSGDRPVLVPIEPCRLVDTRPGTATVGPRSSPLGTADTMTVDAQEPDTDCTGTIPTGALALALNVTSIGATEQSFLTIWAGGDRPNASSLNPSPGAPPTPNAVTVDLSIDQEFEIYNDAGNVNIIADVTGYYENHNHDDRYALRTEVDDATELAKHIQINVFGEADTNFPSTKYDGLADLGVQSQDVDFSFSLPPDYTAGSDIGLRVTAYSPPAEAPCSATLRYNWGTAFRSGEADTNFAFRADDGSESQLVSETKTMATGRIAQVWQYTFAGDNLRPFDAAGFGLFWQGGCAMIISGVILTYE